MPGQGPQAVVEILARGCLLSSQAILMQSKETIAWHLSSGISSATAFAATHGSKSTAIPLGCCLNVVKDLILLMA